MYMALLLHPSYSYLLDCSIASIVGCTFRDAYMMTMLSLHDSLWCRHLPAAPLCGASPWRRRRAQVAKEFIWRDWFYFFILVYFNFFWKMNLKLIFKIWPLWAAPVWLP
jgi:hypothetical protein